MEVKDNKKQAFWNHTFQGSCPCCGCEERHCVHEGLHSAVAESYQTEPQSRGFTHCLLCLPAFWIQVLISSPKKKTSGKKVPKSGIFEGVKVFTAWSTISRSLNHPKPCLLFPFRFFAVEHSGCFAATTRASAAPSGRSICARASSLLCVRPHLLYACLIV